MKPLFIMAILALISGCDVEREKIVSATTADGKVIATLYFENGITVPGYDALYVATADDSDKYANKVLFGKGLQSPNLQWNGRILTLSYRAGNVYEFHSAWRPSSLTADNVEVRLSPQCDGLCFDDLSAQATITTKATPAKARREISSVTSPSGSYTAMLSSEEAAETPNTLYRLRIFSGAETEEEKWQTLVLEAEGIKEPYLTWDAEKPILNVAYVGGEILQFHNVWYDEKAYRTGKGLYKVEIRLNPNCEGMCF